MAAIPVVAFAAYSGTGKTTLIERIVRRLKEKGLRVAVVKHDAHRFEIDREGKDSWRFTQAGADISIVSSPEKTAKIEQGPRSVWEILKEIHGVDMILVEGYKNENLRQIGVCREASGKGLPKAPGHFAAVVTDETKTADEAAAAGVPVFGLDDIEEITEYIMENKKEFTHFNEQGRARMVNVGEKEVTRRTAAAGARVYVSRSTLELIRTGGMKKGDVLTVAQIAGVMGAKRTGDLIPMCHPIRIDGIDLALSLDEERCCVDIRAVVSCDGRTGVEMEALAAVSTAALTVYDMCKAVQRDMVISDIRLLSKTGGVHGDFYREEKDG